jgi:hypothetical protein
MSVLSLTIVVPGELVNERQIAIAAGTVQTAFQVSGTGIDVKWEVVTVTGHDGNVYRDAQFNLEYGHVAGNLNHLRNLAWAVAGAIPRRKYVLFLCRQVVDRHPHTGQFMPSGTNGATIPSEAVSFISVQAPKSTVGDCDGQTWAHEIGHGLGLDHVDDINNLMNPARHGVTGQAAGWELTTTQKWTMYKLCEKLGSNGV